MSTTDNPNLDDPFADSQDRQLVAQRLGSCRGCAGTGAINSGGVTPWMAPIWLKCGCCNGTGDEPSSEEQKAATE